VVCDEADQRLSQEQNICSVDDVLAITGGASMSDLGRVYNVPRFTSLHPSLKLPSSDHDTDLVSAFIFPKRMQAILADAPHASEALGQVSVVEIDRLIPLNPPQALQAAGKMPGECSLRVGDL